jgi:hypothetical protein
MSTVCKMSAARADVELEAWETQRLLSCGVTLSPVFNPIFDLPNRRREASEQSVARGSRPEFVCMSCFRSSKGGAKRSWSSDHETLTNGEELTQLNSKRN